MTGAVASDGGGARLREGRGSEAVCSIARRPRVVEPRLVRGAVVHTSLSINIKVVKLAECFVQMQRHQVQR